MKRYINYLVANSLYLKIPLCFFVMLSISSVMLKQYESCDITVIEFVLYVFQDKLFLSYILTLFLLIFINNLFRVRNIDLQYIIRLKTTIKWYIANFSACVINCLILVILIFLSLAFVSYFNGFKPVLFWSECVQMSSINFVDGLDYTGHPFDILIINETSPFVALVQGIFTLFFRCLFYANLVNVLQILVKNRLITIFVVILMNIIDVYFYNIFVMVNMFVLPSEHSIVTSIAGESTRFLFSLIYWLLAIIGSTIFCIINSHTQIDYMIISQSKQ